MKLLKKILSILILIIGVFLVLRIFDPSLDSKVLGLIGNQKAKEDLQSISSETGNKLRAVLGDKTQSSGDLGVDAVNMINALKSEILTDELIMETTQKVNQEVNKKIEEAKQLPEKQIEAIKKEVKQEIYQGICENWLKEELLEEN